MPDSEFSDLLPAEKKLAIAVRAVEYNIFQNNGRGVPQLADHVHVHMVGLLIRPCLVEGFGGLIIWWCWVDSQPECKGGVGDQVAGTGYGYGKVEDAV